MKAAVVFWSQTGNTEIMANAVAEGMKEAGAEVDVLTCDQFSASALGTYGVVAFGCPAMGDEVLEETEFEPMFAGLEGALGGKKVGLFGSYGWGDGQWMRDWVDRCRNAGANVVGEGLILNGTPDADGEEECKAYGKSLC